MAFAPLTPPIWPGSSPLERQLSSTSPASPTQKQKQTPESTKGPSSSSARLPPPTLFQGPPSRNASNISLHIPGANAAAIGLPASVSASAIPTSSPEHLHRIPSRRPAAPKDVTDPSSAGSAGPTGGDTRGTLPRTTTTDTNAKRENDRADALWAEMQHTLAEVELNAANGSHIFGAGHAHALEELRTAQLALAQAWAKSEADEVGGGHATRDDAEDDDVLGTAAGAVGALMGGKEKEKEKEGKKNGAKQQQQQQQPGSGAGEDRSEKARRKTLEEETENDIMLARMRREANDRYFGQVNNAVVDVVKKLDVVAGAMRKVEKESRDIWSEDGDGSESVTGSTTGE